MAIPTGNDVQAVDPVLTNMLVGYMQADDRFIATKAFPSVPVDKDSGTFFILTKKYWFLDELETRAYGDNFARAGYGVETSTYTTLQWALEHPIPDETRANSQLPMDLESIGVQWLAQQSLIRKERLWAADFSTTSVWGTDGSVSNKWSDYAASDPVSDVRTAMRTVSANTGKRPNTMIMGEIVDDRLQNHPDIIDRLKYVQVATVGNITNALADLFGCQKYLVGRASYNTANEGQTFSGSAILDDDILICYTDDNAGIFGASAGKTFAWAPGGGMGGIRQYYADNADSNILKHKEQWDQVVTASDLGYRYADCTD